MTSSFENLSTENLAVSTVGEGFEKEAKELLISIAQSSAVANFVNLRFGKAEVIKKGNYAFLSLPVIGDLLKDAADGGAVTDLEFELIASFDNSGKLVSKRAFQFKGGFDMSYTAEAFQGL